MSAAGASASNGLRRGGVGKLGDVAEGGLSASGYTDTKSRLQTPR